MNEIPKQIPKRIVEEASQLGGIDLDETEDITERLSCDKGSHKERSLANQKNHLIFWKKEKESDKKGKI